MPIFVTDDADHFGTNAIFELLAATWPGLERNHVCCRPAVRRLRTDRYLSRLGMRLEIRVGNDLGQCR